VLPLADDLLEVLLTSAEKGRGPEKEQREAPACMWSVYTLPRGPRVPATSGTGSQASLMARLSSGRALWSQASSTSTGPEFSTFVHESRPMYRFRRFAARLHARNLGPGGQRGRAPVAAQRRMMPQPEQDLRERLEVGFICVRYGRLEVVHDDRLAEGIVYVPARSDPRLQDFERMRRDAAVIEFHRRAAMITPVSYIAILRFGPAENPISKTVSELLKIRVAKKAC